MTASPHRDWTVPRAWTAAAGAWEDRIALIESKRSVTYGELDSLSEALARLVVAELSSGRQPVAILAPNSIEFALAYLAITKAGHAAMPIDVRLSAGAIASILDHSGAPVVLVHEECEREAAFAIERSSVSLAVRSISISTARLRASAERSNGAISRRLPENADADSLAELMYTSGSTGSPKGVMRSHRNVLAAACNAISGFGYRASDVMAIAMPLSHSSALTSQLLPMLLAGGRTVLLRQFVPNEFLGVLEKEQVSCVRVVPAMLSQLLAHSGLSVEALPALHAIINSSAPAPPELLAEVKTRLPAVRIMNSYGLTEASTCTVLGDDEILEHADSVGRAIPPVSLRITSDDGTECAPGEEGEILVRGDHVAIGYWRRPREEFPLTADGWLRTGDLARGDESGLIYLSGRRDEVINCGGNKVRPSQIEQALRALDGVLDAAVVGVPHRILGEVPRAFVVLAEGSPVTGRGIIRELTGKLPAYMVPFAVEICDSIPRGSLGKVLRESLLRGASRS